MIRCRSGKAVRNFPDALWPQTAICGLRARPAVGVAATIPDRRKSQIHKQRPEEDESRPLRTHASFKPPLQACVRVWPGMQPQSPVSNSTSASRNRSPERTLAANGLFRPARTFGHRSYSCKLRQGKRARNNKQASRIRAGCKRPFFAFAHVQWPDQ